MATILITDTGRVALKTIRRGLRTRGYQVVEMPGGRDTLEYLSGKHRVDLVLADYSLPEMNGVDLLQAIRRINACLPVIIMSAGSHSDRVKDALVQPWDAFIDKPFDIQSLRGMIDALLRKKHPARADDMSVVQREASDRDV